MDIAIPERLEHGEENRWIVLLVNDKKKSKPKRKASVEKRSEEKRKAIRRSPPSLSFWKLFWFVYESPSPVLLVFQQEGKADVWDPWRVTIGESPPKEAAKQWGRTCFCFHPFVVNRCKFSLI